MSALSIQSLKRGWGGELAVNDVSFEVPAGSMTVLLGPSGCGKSTTLRLLAGLERPDSGRILLGGRDVTDLPPAARGLSMVFQNYALLPHLTVAENIVFGLKIRRVAPAERAKRLRHAADVLGLQGLLMRKPGQLSGGQQQRVALGRAIVARSSVCLMDEPLSNLDAQLRHEMRREIRDLQQRLGMTMVYVTHDQTEAMSMADQVILMRGGRIEQQAAPSELYHRPATHFAARFIGVPPMNLVPLENRQAGAVLPGTEICLWPGRAPQSISLGLRPESIRLSGAGGVSAVLDHVEYHGADHILSCRIGAAMLAVRHDSHFSGKPGDALMLSWPESACHFFDSATGLRLDGPGALNTRQSLAA
ncbi:ABC transporter ATP-binding protein [Kerstersia sp.]|uniref:ABC transporter ATP-binding protein n=1 Tax=Kerstersia sp. TaxID=1930783 RepID=UPI003F9372AB